MVESCSPEQESEKYLAPLQPYAKHPQNISSIILSRSHPDTRGQDECSYCKATRGGFFINQESSPSIKSKISCPTDEIDQIWLEEETGLKYFKCGMTSTKMRACDYEHLL